MISFTVALSHMTPGTKTIIRSTIIIIIILIMNLNMYTHTIDLTVCLVFLIRYAINLILQHLSCDAVQCV